MKYDLSICFPSIRVSLLDKVYESISMSCKRYSWELVIVGPYIPSQYLLDKNNFKFIEDWGHPTRCCQIGADKCHGRYFTWGSDDAIWLNDTLDSCLDTIQQTENTGLIIQYLEKASNGWSNMPAEWYTAHHHLDLRLAGINKNWKIAPVGMYELSLFRDMGGFDCKFEHLNFSCHDLAFRLQKANFNLKLSPDIVFECEWSSQMEDHLPIHESHFEHDVPVFTQMWSHPNDRLILSYNNWEEQDNIWKRRFMR